jgi:hypothetical protein
MKYNFFLVFPIHFKFENIFYPSVSLNTPTGLFIYYRNPLGSVILPVTAVAAAVAGLAK